MPDWTMHDWTLKSISLDWRPGALAIGLLGPKSLTAITARDIRELHVPRRFGWGPSASVQSIEGPTKHDGELLRLTIQMHSGDVIEIVAAAFDLPAKQPWEPDSGRHPLTSG
jgi:hypothetical protein